ncbi:MAG: flagellar export chaperone FliS [Betaproteobacteria bacterium]|jgi:flagellar protein FliS
MNAVYASAMNTYARTEVETGVNDATPEKLIVMLYDGAIRAISTAHLAMQRHDLTTKGIQISKAIGIIEEGLNGSLDLKAGGEIARNLADLYDYMCNRLLTASARNDLSALEEVRRLLSELRDAWNTLVTRQNAAANPDQPAQRADASSYGKA